MHPRTPPSLQLEAVSVPPFPIPPPTHPSRHAAPAQVATERAAALEQERARTQVAVLAATQAMAEQLASRQAVRGAVVWVGGELGLGCGVWGEHSSGTLASWIIASCMGTRARLPNQAPAPWTATKPCGHIALLKEPLPR